MCQKCWQVLTSTWRLKSWLRNLCSDLSTKKNKSFFCSPSGALFKGAHIKSQFGRTVRICQESVGVSRGQCGFLPHLLLAVALRNFIAPWWACFLMICRRSFLGSTFFRVLSRPGWVGGCQGLFGVFTMSKNTGNQSSHRKLEYGSRVEFSKTTFNTNMGRCFEFGRAPKKRHHKKRFISSSWSIRGLPGKRGEHRWSPWGGDQISLPRPGLGARVPLVERWLRAVWEAADGWWVCGNLTWLMAIPNWKVSFCMGFPGKHWDVPASNVYGRWWFITKSKGAWNTCILDVQKAVLYRLIYRLSSRNYPGLSHLAWKARGSSH